MVILILVLLNHFLHDVSSELLCLCVCYAIPSQKTFRLLEIIDSRST